MELSQHLTSLVGNEINILLSDGNSIEGVLAAVKCDYFVVETEKNIFYHNIKNMKGLLKSTKGAKNSKKSKIHSLPITDYSSEGMTLREVLENHQAKWVSVNTQGNQNNKNGYSGFLAELGDDYIILVGKEAQVYLNISHVNTIVKANESNMQSNNENNNENSNNSNYSEMSGMPFDSVFGGSHR